MEYEAELERRPGTKHQLPDALSRLFPPGPSGPDIDASLRDDYLDSFAPVVSSPLGPMLEGDFLINIIPHPGPVSPTDSKIPPLGPSVSHAAPLCMVVDLSSLSPFVLSSDLPSSMADSAPPPPCYAVDFSPVPDRFTQLQSASLPSAVSSTDTQPSFFASLQPDLPPDPRRSSRVRIPSVRLQPISD